MTWVCISEDDLDHIVGEAKAEVKGQAKAAAVEERIPDESLPQPGVEDILGPSGEAPAQEEEKDTREKAPLVG
ncbi:UNVERIFIED_CONTAM: hypothetical protein Slati_3661800 [Sesamum latifolium]|uniref:Uncharacterized protein n=1 Tax=Sesamum latifolium TaxID=2727402 RepID=A0AAW2U0D1_9LAMI